MSTACGAVTVLWPRSAPWWVLTGQHTGRSPKDKFIVEEPSTRDQIWWGEVNAGISEQGFERLYGKLVSYFENRELFVQDLYAGADPEYRLSVRVVSESAWHSLFARNMFIEPGQDALAGFAPEFTVLHAPYLGVRSGDRRHQFRHLHRGPLRPSSDSGRRFGLCRRDQEVDFSVLNYLLPARGVLPMHCSANIGARDDTAIFFGLSGTGKTTLSADGSRRLIGDDEHGWSDAGVFNFEGGCYAKVIRLSAQAEPEIYATTRRFGTILENVVLDETTGKLDLDDDRYTENTRASYPLDFIPNVSESGRGGHTENVVMLTADAFGVLPRLAG